MVNQEEIELMSKAFPFWDKLTNTEKDLLISNANPVSFSKGQIMNCGEKECVGILLIKSGSLRTFITSDEGREVTLYRLEERDICILSASCVIPLIDFDVYIETETDCEIIQISSMIFQQLSSKNIHVELFSYKITTDRFSDVMWAMQQILFTSFDKRLAGFLLEESMKNKSNTINMTHEQIAKYLGTAREVVSRMLKYFSKEGYVSLSRGDITIIDKDKLNSII